MKVAFHFDTNYKDFNGSYGIPINRELYTILLSKRNINISSKIFIGDLLLHHYAMEKVSKKSTVNSKSTTFTLNKEKYLQLFHNWTNSLNLTWNKFAESKLKMVLNTDVYVVCFESIDLETSEFINSELEKYPAYLGALQVDDSSKIHWVLYSDSLIPFTRIINKTLSIFYTDPEEDRDYWQFDEMKNIGFEKVEWECLNGKYTIFDNYHNYEHARRISEWNKKAGSLLSFVVENVTSQLSDIAPDLTNKLWSALQTFERGETNEDYAQVASSCRRIFEYVINCIFPPRNEVLNGHSLDKIKYKNRLFAYADEARQSDTNIDLIVASTSTLFESWDKLNNLTNKGIHDEIFRSEARRSLLRTIMLLDDIVSLKSTAFEIKPSLNFDQIFK